MIDDDTLDEFLSGIPGFEPFEVDGIVYRRPHPLRSNGGYVRLMFELVEDHRCGERASYSGYCGGVWGATE